MTSKAYGMEHGNWMGMDASIQNSTLQDVTYNNLKNFSKDDIRDPRGNNSFNKPYKRGTFGHFQPSPDKHRLHEKSTSPGNSQRFPPKMTSALSERRPGDHGQS
mmetsp:Transcript_4461/g.6622  ORF Transcript_4461/g.6622 Transcript_4461/m.6622 type:complete len:104 (+) Transcript_4461:224-535(+)